MTGVWNSLFVFLLFIPAAQVLSHTDGDTTTRPPSGPREEAVKGCLPTFGEVQGSFKGPDGKPISLADPKKKKPTLVISGNAEKDQAKIEAILKETLLLKATQNLSLGDVFRNPLDVLNRAKDFSDTRFILLSDIRESIWQGFGQAEGIAEARAQRSRSMAASQGASIGADVGRQRAPILFKRIGARRGAQIGGQTGFQTAMQVESVIRRPAMLAGVQEETIKRMTEGISRAKKEAGERLHGAGIEMGVIVDTEWFSGNATQVPDGNFHWANSKIAESWDPQAQPFDFQGARATHQSFLGKTNDIRSLFKVASPKPGEMKVTLVSADGKVLGDWTGGDVDAKTVAREFQRALAADKKEDPKDADCDGVPNDKDLCSGTRFLSLQDPGLTNEEIRRRRAKNSVHGVESTQWAGCNRGQFRDRDR